ncbi:hypothetical protein HMPREF1978_00269 [Actinomyces graevenitzii F0530]|uniref:Uncharacterized protein n=1 Tax=Actinomyces graevenitzii F0530 TaxID=1321817 RepID=U1Q807_9ACTO|nr:hypothetical protein HMPREF1978_00269 [Actinomyces graevenitzii F0530]
MLRGGANALLRGRCFVSCAGAGAHHANALLRGRCPGWTLTGPLAVNQVALRRR